MLPSETVIPLNLILNIILVSLPEEYVLVSFCLIFMGRYELAELKRENLGRISVPILIPAVASNMLRYYIPSTGNYMFALTLVVFPLLIVFAYGFFKPEEIFKSVIGSFLALITAAVIQTAYVPLLKYGLQISLNDTWSFGFPSFLFALPERIIEVSLLIFMFAGKKSFLKSGLIRIITESRGLAAVTAFILSANVAFLAFVIWIVGCEKLLVGLPVIKQLIFMALVISLPIVNITALLFVIHHIKDSEARRIFALQEELRVSIEDIRFFLSKKQYDRIKEEVAFLENDTKELFKEK